VTRILRTGYEHLRRAVARVRTWFEPPLDADARPLEIRDAIVDRVERAVEPAAAGRRLLPHNHLVVTVLAAGKDERAAMRVVLGDLAQAIRTRLAEIRCTVPAGFAVDVQYAQRARPGWDAGARFAIEFAGRTVARAAPSNAPPPPGIRVKVVRGRATQASYMLTDGNVRIGRTALPTDHLGRPRHNHIAFVEEGDEHSLTVGRAHASICYDAARREYRLFDDGSHNGTRVVRSGATLTVAPRDPVGVTLLSGDEVQFGTAAVRVEIDGSVEVLDARARSR
jgi:hypothetical protein